MVLRPSQVFCSFDSLDPDEGAGLAGGNDLLVVPLDPLVGVVNTEACRNTVSDRFGASDEIIVIKLFTAESDDLNEDNHAAFASWVICLTCDQCRYRKVFALGTCHGTHKSTVRVFDGSRCSVNGLLPFGEAIGIEESLACVRELGFELLTGHG